MKLEWTVNLAYTALLIILSAAETPLWHSGTFL